MIAKLLKMSKHKSFVDATQNLIQTGVEKRYLHPARCNNTQQFNKQVLSNKDAAFQCNFLFNIFFHSMDNLFTFKLISLDFSIDFANFTMSLQAYRGTDRQTDGQNNGQTDKIMVGQTNEWMDMQYMCIDMKKTIIFQQIL